ncbi:MAG: hypothetical protein BWY32_03576 [bacterium ADurb.Bin243]|nr:MAG: hypothetical protein BWY32_03576 [bacterium ADurb.Bin243]
MAKQKTGIIITIGSPSLKPTVIIDDLINPSPFEFEENDVDNKKIEIDDPGAIDVIDDDDDEQDHNETDPDGISEGHSLQSPEKKYLAGSIRYDGKKISYSIFPNYFKYKQNTDNIKLFFESFDSFFGNFIKAPADKIFLYLKPLTQLEMAEKIHENLPEPENSDKEKPKIGSFSSWLSVFASKYYIKINNFDFDICDLFDQKVDTLNISEFAITVLISRGNIWPLIELADTDVERSNLIEKYLDDILSKQIGKKLFKKNISQAGKTKTLINAYDKAFENRDLILLKYF